MPWTILAWVSIVWKYNYEIELIFYFVATINIFIRKNKKYLNSNHKPRYYAQPQFVILSRNVQLKIMIMITLPGIHNTPSHAYNNHHNKNKK